MEEPAQPVTARPGGRTARTRQHVLDAVTALLVEQGYEALTVDAVAARSGVHRTTVYRRWRDAGGLLADALDAAREQPWEPPDTGSLAGDLGEINRQVADALTGTPPIAAALIAASFRSPTAARALRSFWEDRYARAAVVVHRAISRGEATTGTDPRTVIVAACAPVFHELVLMRAPDTEDLAQRYAELAAAGTAAAGGTTAAGTAAAG
ncbi:TetR/AcrR family transcriptional regulator [Actinoplanes sp. DH11]|uniref:TetR/AcrR family transcriptional regulator n=1 Tax=Actinoplanes sp. DH11 TaxID=2857011 RepID=UPI001E5E616B|nr:TetR/AcrR family transcriptional regulator [Actinoplanes sp. DH11]